MVQDDMSQWTGLGPTPVPLLAIGWLGPWDAGADSHDVEPVFARLVEFFKQPWQPGLFLGVGDCARCRFTRGPTWIDYRGTRIELGRSNLFVPDDGRAYIAPSMILHYMDSHGYVPPKVFSDAVERCPPMRSMAYLKKIRELGLHRLPA